MFSDISCTTTTPCTYVHVGDNFSVSNDKLFCSGCREQLALNKSVTKQNIKSHKLKTGKEKLQLNAKREIGLVKSFKEFDAKNHPDVLGEHAYSLFDSSNLRKIIPFILKREIKWLKETIGGNQILVFLIVPTCVKL